VDSFSKSVIRRLFSSEYGASDRLIVRWLFLRALGLIYFSAFYSLVFQIRGLIGPQGILPAGEYLQAVAQSRVAHVRFWYAPSVLWISSGSGTLMALCWIGMIASILLVLNLWPRAMLMICLVCFLSFVSTARDFSEYQSDGMLPEAGLISLFFAPPGLRPGFGAKHPASRASLFLLQWEWFRIYFESGIVKLASGEPQWRNFTAMDEYYQNGPLPTWIGWYLQHLPRWFHASSAFATLVMELGLIWMIFLPRRFRIILFCIVTIWELGVISSANYAFLNYLVLSLGILLVEDRWLLRWIPGKWRAGIETEIYIAKTVRVQTERKNASMDSEDAVREGRELRSWTVIRSHFGALRLALSAVMLTWSFYVTTALLILILAPRAPLPTTPILMLEPFRIANQYGLFAVMTRGRYEVEFQGSSDGENWIPYRFRYKPQALNEAPRIYAPYQPRFDWNLWFASLGSWTNNSIVPNTEVRLLANDADVLSLFRNNPFPKAPPKRVRAVLWQYWFTTMAEKRATGNWWRRQLLGPYAPTLELQSDGKVEVVDMPPELPLHR
jgi:lipase maturation factor